jgi:hypothetical protein
MECWEVTDDPRSGNAAVHDFHEPSIVVLCAVLCGGQSAVEMALFAEVKEPVLRGFLDLANGQSRSGTAKGFRRDRPSRRS